MTIDLQYVPGYNWARQWSVRVTKNFHKNVWAAVVGYGSPLNDNSSCQVETPTAAQPCQAQTRSLWQVQPGFWYRFYKGSAGTVAMGMSYSYTYRSTWAGFDSMQPKGIENIVMTSFRYYFP